MLVANVTGSRSLYFSIDATAGGKKTGLAFNTAGLKASYTVEQGATTLITLVTQTPTGAYSSGGFCEMSAANAPGLYRLDVPDISLAYFSGVISIFGAAGMVQVDRFVQLDPMLYHLPGDSSYTVADFLKLFAAVLLGTSSGMELGTPTFKSIDGAGNTRVQAATDTNGNRSAVVLTPS